jgi:hypothetical protein
MAESAYNVGKTRIAAGDTALDSSDLRMLLIITSKTGASDPDLGTLAAIDAVGTVAFHSERLALASLTVTQDNANDRANADAANLAFAAAPGVTALAAIIYDHAAGGSDATRFPLFFYDTGFGAGIPIDGGLNVTIADFARLT